MNTVAPAPRIRGRVAEIAVLGEALDRAAAGQPAVVLIEGEAGIGKTRLLAETLADARGRSTAADPARPGRGGRAGTGGRGRHRRARPGADGRDVGAAGNPLFVTELLAALAQEGAITTAGGRAEVAKMALPPTLRLTIVRRLSFLPDATLQVLRTASILGTSFTVTDLATVTARSALELSAALAQAVTTHVIEDDGTHLRFRHDLIRDAIYEDLPLSVAARCTARPGSGWQAGTPRPCRSPSTSPARQAPATRRPSPG